MANPTESVEKYATAVLSGSLMALALLVHVDGQVGGVFTMLGKVHNIPDTWSFVAVVPALAIIYALGLIVTTGSALFVNWLQHPFKEKEKDALAVMADAKNDLLNLKFGEIIRSWKTLEGMFIPLLFLLVGIIQESFRYSHLDTYLRYAAFLVLVLLVLCPMYAWHIAKSVDDVLEAALDGAGANLSISVECDRSPIAQGVDALAVTVKLIKGDRGSVDLRDAKGRVFSSSRADPMHLDFTDIVRLDFDSKNPKVVWDKPNVRRPQIRFAPGGIMEMSTHCLVPTAEVCKIEIVILGSVVNAFRHQPTSRYRTMKRILAWGRRIVARVRRAKNIEEPAESIKEPVVSQWRASRVSLPSCPAGVRA